MDKLKVNFHKNNKKHLSRRQFLKNNCMLLGGLYLYGCSSSSDNNTPLPTAPTITVEPLDASILIGSSATFLVETTGSSPLTFQWYRNDESIIDATETSYSLKPASLSEDGSSFSVKITNQSGSVRSRIAILNITSVGTTIDTTSIQIDSTLITIDEI
ncbi:MAG: hypothetical protein QM504_02415 [Pseudomonadota bacterium]